MYSAADQQVGSRVLFEKYNRNMGVSGCYISDSISMIRCSNRALGTIERFFALVL